MTVGFRNDTVYCDFKPILFIKYPAHFPFLNGHCMYVTYLQYARIQKIKKVVEVDKVINYFIYKGYLPFLPERLYTNSKQHSCIIMVTAAESTIIFPLELAELPKQNFFLYCCLRIYPFLSCVSCHLLQKRCS